MHRGRVAGSARAERAGRLAGFAYELLVFAIKQAWACLFGALMLLLLLLTHLGYPDGFALARYDFLVLAAVAIQIALLSSGLEHPEEARVILLYHVVGTVMEIFKTEVGSWAYPEESVLRIGGVPLFSGFMYAAVGSYIARAWRIFDFRFTRYPRRRYTLVLALLVYVNFFTHHYLPDIRYGLFAMAALLFGRSWVHFRVDQARRRMPLVVGFALVALFIWLAENIGTFARAWIYPTQGDGWHAVSIAKLGSWFLLMLISFVLVSLIRRPRAVLPIRGDSVAVDATPVAG